MMRVTARLLLGMACVWIVTTHLSSQAIAGRDQADALCAEATALLESGDLDAAEERFERAVKADGDYAPAYNGLGLVWRERPNGLRTAIRYFRKALQYDRDFVAARFHIAQARYALKEYDVKRDLDKVVRMDSTFAPAYLMLGEWYETWKEDFRKAEEHYRHYVALEPEDLSGIVKLAAVSQKTGQAREVVRLLAKRGFRDPKSVKVLPVLAMAYVSLDSLEQAEAVYRNFLDRCGPVDRMLYEDIRLLASPDEYEAYVTAADREAFLERFWQERDPDLTTAANERRLEHYRRVWYARQNFSEAKKPWDTRGEVYVRFGEPDHRSRSDAPNSQQTAAVQRVRESLAFQFYPPLFVHLQNTFLVTFPVRSKKDVGTTWSPVVSNDPDVSMVPWESWVYVNSGVGGGMEITFTDESLNGTYDYAPPPMSDDFDVRRQAMFSRLSPMNVAMRTAARNPNYYQPPANEDPLEFYYDFADFRGGTDTSSVVEVYTGVPHRFSEYVEAQDATWLEVTRAVAMLNLESGAVYRDQREVRFRGDGDLTQTVGGFVPDVARLELPPGSYRMEVQAADRRSGRHGLYRQNVEVTAYPEDSLRVSDIELAWRITETGEQDVFSKRGLHVVPMPIRMYGKGQSVYVYYEIYNLRRDAFGRTHYRVAYSVRDQGRGLLTGIARLVRFRGMGREEVAVTYEQHGTTATQAEHVALDLGDVQGGRQVLLVSVTDLNSGASAEAETAFLIQDDAAGRGE